MKNALSLLLILGLALTSCSEDLTHSGVTNDQYSNFDDLLTAIADDAESVDVTADEMMEYHIEWNKTIDQISMVSAEKTTIDIVPMVSRKQDGNGDSYNVDCCCDADGELIFSKTCDGKWSCGTLISDCLEDGSCAEICNATIHVIPNTANTVGIISVTLN